MVLDKLGDSLKNTLKKIAGSIFVDDKLINELVKDIQRALLQADVNVQLVFDLTSKIKDRIKKEETPSGLTKKEHLINIVYEELVDFLGKEQYKIEIKEKPFKIMLVGLFGSGKTTTAGKLASYFAKRGHKVALLGLDTHRPAAMDQIEQIAKQAKVHCLLNKKEKDPLKIWNDYKNEYKKYDILIIDTSGRDALSKDLIEEIETLNEKSVKARETAVESLKKKDALGDISEEVPESVSNKIPEKIKEKIGIKGKPETVGKPEEVAAPATVPEEAAEVPAKKTPDATTEEVAAPEIIPEEITETPTGTLLMQITDAPPELNITKALVNISDVEVHLAGADEEGWFTVVEEAKIFDLIAIENVTEFLGTEELSVGKYTQIRLNINEALVTINGTEYDLTIPSKTIKLVKSFNIEPNETTTLTLDFDAQESIHSAGVDKYIMRPTIKVIQE